jgi:alpha-1,6-mannosyltransferase
VHAGDQETFGLIALEAMACGRPIIATHSGALTEIVHADNGILAAPRDSAALAQAVRALYDRDIGALGRQARRYVETHFSWDTVMASLVTCYTQLAATGSVAAVPSYATH